MQPQDDQSQPQTPPQFPDTGVPSFNANDPANVSPAQQSNPQDFTFQIPKNDGSTEIPLQSTPPSVPEQPPAPAPQIPSFDAVPQIPEPTTPVTPPPTAYEQPPVAPPPRAPMPDMHEPPIFMREEGPVGSTPPIPPLGGPPPFSVGGQAPQDPSIQPMQRPVQSAANISQVSIPRRKQNSLLKLVVFAVLGLLMAGLLIWAVVAIVGSRSSGGEAPAEKTEEKKVQNNDYESDQLGFATQYPKDWTQEQSQEDGLDVVTFSHPTVRDNQTALAEVAVIRLTQTQLKDIKDKETFYSTYQKAITDGFENYSEIGSEELTISELPAKKVTADIAQKGSQDQAIFHFIFAETDGFIIVGYADKEKFKDLEDELNLVVAKFESRINSASEQQPASE